MRHPLAAAARARFQRVILSFSILSGIALTGGLPTEARANEDTGMMAFVLGASARRAPARVFFEAPIYRQVGPYARSPSAQPVRAAHRKPVVRRHLASISHAKAASGPVATDARPETGQSGSALQASLRDGLPVERAHLSDKTLRAGDIVATAAGLRVFRGSDQYPFRDADFAPISAAGKIQNRAVLEALDRTMRRGEPSRHQIALQAPKVAALRVRTAQASDAPAAPVATASRPAQAVASATPEKPSVVKHSANAYAPAAQAKEPASAVRAIERALRRDNASRMQTAAPRKARQAWVWRRPLPPRAFGTAWAVAPVRTLAPSYVGFWR